jgi:hypothetical protein
MKQTLTASSLAFVGPIQSKRDIYEMILAIRNADRTTAKGSPIYLYVEDLIGPDHVGGEYELARELLSLQSRRELLVHAQDSVIGTVGLSLLSFAQKRSANQPAMIGGFGDYSVVRDSYGVAVKKAIGVKVVRAGSWKGIGTPGTLLSDEQVAELGRPALESTLLLFKELQTVRKWSPPQSEELLSGKVFFGADLMRMKLVDSIQSADEFWGRS